MAKKKTKITPKENNAAPKSMADSIPYFRVYSNGVIEVRQYEFSKSYTLVDLNFKTKSDEDQGTIATKWGNFIGQIDHSVRSSITLYNRTVDLDDFKSEVLIPLKGDKEDFYRDELNNMYLDKMTIAKNNLTTVKILTLTITAENIEAANTKFNQLDTIVSDELGGNNTEGGKPLTLVERLDILNEIYNQNHYMPISQERTINGRVQTSFSLENCAMQGITTKEVIAPEQLNFTVNDNTFQVSDKFGRSYYIATYPNWLKATALTDFAEMPCNMLVTVHFEQIEHVEAIKLLKRQNVNIDSSIIERQKKASRSGYDPSIGSPELSAAKDEISALMDKVTKEDEKLYVTVFLITIFADTKEELEELDESLRLIANGNLCQIKALTRMQERGFDSSLPLGYNNILTQRLMSTETISVIQPYSVQEVQQKDGTYYGLNAVSHNMIRYNRQNDINPCGCILGMPGAGKSFAAKREMINALLRYDDEVYVIDPEGENVVVAKELGGNVINVSNGSNVYINPFDLYLDDTIEDGGDPVKKKSDFITSVMEIMVGNSRYGLSPIEQTIIDRCVILLYDPYIKYCQENKITFDVNATPTLIDFYNVLMRQPEPEAKQMGLGLERYAKGSTDIFSHHTNIDIKNRFTVYNIRDIGTGLKELGLQICLDNVWNNMINNKNKGKRTWFYIDEFYLLMQKQRSAEYVSMIWKRARKWNGIPTAITQNVEDMLKSEEARTIINNSAFVQLLTQAPLNVTALSNLMDISKNEQKYITSSKSGTGLLKIGNSLIPFMDEFPKDTELYRIMSTKPNEHL